jgi:hypothetical protein
MDYGTIPLNLLLTLPIPYAHLLPPKYPSSSVENTISHPMSAHHLGTYTQIYLLQTQFIVNRHTYRIEMKFNIEFDTVYKKV